MPGAGHRRPEPIGLRHRPHRHEPAIAPAGQPKPLLIDRRRMLRRSHPRQDVAQIAMPEILHVGPRERLALAIAAARVGQEQRVPGIQQLPLIPLSHENRLAGRRRPAMHVGDHPQLAALRRALRQQQPPLHTWKPSLAQLKDCAVAARLCPAFACVRSCQSPSGPTSISGARVKVWCTVAVTAVWQSPANCAVPLSSDSAWLTIGTGIAAAAAGDTWTICVWSPASSEATRCNPSQLHSPATSPWPASSA